MMRKLNFKNWKIVDIDHYMKGNTFFKSVVPDNQFYKNIDQYLGTPQERLIDYSNEDNQKRHENDINKFLKFIAKKEPRSNRGLDVFLSQEEIDEANKLLEQQSKPVGTVAQKKDKKGQDNDKQQVPQDDNAGAPV